MEKDYELIIIGGGPAGLTAGLYAGRARIKALLIEKAFFGGMIVNTDIVENYPGFPQGVSGFELGQLLHQQAQKFGVEMVNAEVTGLEFRENKKIIRTGEGNFTANAVIIASGSEIMKLNVPGEKEFTGHGVSYCATCDGAFFRGLPVAVIGGSDAALSEALPLTRFASKVYIIHRRSELRAAKSLQEKVFAEPGITFIWDTVVEAIEGQDKVDQIKLRNVKTEESSVLGISGVFVYVGLRPVTGYLKGIVPLTPEGYVITNEKMETTFPGIYAAGDVRRPQGRQVITAAGDGATALMYAERYLTGEK